MSSAAPVTAFRCTQCGGELHPDEGQRFLTCPFCSSTVYLDKSLVVFHWFVAPTLDAGQARASLARWMAGNQTVKDLDKKAILSDSSFEYFPLWYFKHREASGTESVLLEPAAAISISELKQLRLPAGDLRKYEHELDGSARAPTVPMAAAVDWLKAARQIQEDELAERALVHIPLYTFKYQYAGRDYTAVVEAATGQTFANIYPAKSETPYVAVGVLAAATFLCLASFPLIGGLAEGSDGLGAGLAVCAAAGIPAALGMFGLAAWVAAKI